MPGDPSQVLTDSSSALQDQKPHPMDVSPDRTDTLVRKKNVRTFTIPRETGGVARYGAV